MMHAHSYRWIGLVLVLVLLAGCSRSEYRDRRSDYHQAQSAEHTLPEAFAQGDAMPIPVSERRGSGQPEQAPRPEPMRVLDERDGLVQQRVDEQGAWLLVMRSPGEVWTSLQAFADSQDVAVISASPRRGEITLADDQSSGLAAQRMTLRQGVRRGTSEVRLRSVSDQQQLPFSEYDRGRLMSLEAFLAASLAEEGSRVSLQAQSLHASQLVRLVDRDDRKVLVMQLDYDRAWAELVHLLEDEFTDEWQKVSDLNRSEGRIYVRYVPQQERPGGFWSRLFRRGPPASAHHYQLHLAEYNQELDLVLEVTPDVPAPLAVEQELLGWLERQLR
ncbi:outer membrane protein assembly factor BamC [Marinospirillum alkaliphilum]|uniref:Uncharacterized lipoprotein n=1 Tax=Marinospirillum alkaliphilum DSM 21637 TaxID=1122209 RepID=A0A1K1W0J1_9GAMM|nr:outer membrane protein assembly factor BamC [Marinospirillum alkaliphilum]SFX30743.1 Uncharacterized lipoprotein [Marinospirillum alkaliphilum DSM 21637]